MTIEAIFMLIGQITALGASPAVQQLVLAQLTKMAGISQDQLQKALAEAQYVGPPKQ